MQHFAGEDMGFSHDFADIARVARDCDALIAHWRHRGVEMLDLDYEAFVAAPDLQRTRLAEFIGVDARAFALNDPTVCDVVKTASVWQVRQPVHTRSIRRWRHYVSYLPELATLFPE